MLSLPVALLGLAVTLPPVALAFRAQVPLEPSSRWQDKHPTSGHEDHPVKWSLDELPNPNATDHLVFDTVYSLLQHWPSIRHLHGHNIVPGIIPKGTLLYHARSDSEVPAVPDWVAMDPEHSYWSCGGTESAACWHLTLTTTRPLKVVYFDGLSATNSEFGQMDTQDLLAFGEADPDRVLEDRPRINALCGWGKNLNVDGFVRAEMAFEIMLCDFDSGTSIVSFVNQINLHGMPTDTTQRVTFEAWHAGSWHNYFPGETRIQLDLSGLTSFYDTELAPSLVAIRANQERREHRVRDISKEDLSAAVSKLAAALTRPTSPSSSIDWKTLIQVVVDRYAGRLELTRNLLNTSITNPEDIPDLANKTQMQLRIMLTPYLSVSAAPADPSDESALDWTAPAYELCATTHTRWMESELNTMTDSEKLLLRAVKGTSREICRVVTKMWAAGVYAGLDSSVNAKVSPDVAEVTRVWNGWKKDLDSLMKWLDWSMWSKCEPGCGREEICVLIEWPHELSHVPISLQEASAGEAGTGVPIVFALKPKCVSLIDLQVKG